MVFKLLYNQVRVMGTMLQTLVSVYFLRLSVLCGTIMDPVCWRVSIMGPVMGPGRQDHHRACLPRAQVREEFPNGFVGRNVGAMLQYEAVQTVLDNQDTLQARDQPSQSALAQMVWFCRWSVRRLGVPVDSRFLRRAL